MMKGGAMISLEKLRSKLNPEIKNTDLTNTLGYEINQYLNRIARFIIWELKRNENNELMQHYVNSIKISVESNRPNGQVRFIPIMPTALQADIRGVMDAIKQKYSDTYFPPSPPPQRKCLDFSFCRRSDNYLTATYKLTPVAFNQVLDFVCSGKIHESTRLSAKIVLKSDNDYQDLLQSLTTLYKHIDPPKDEEYGDAFFGKQQTKVVVIPDFSLPAGFTAPESSTGLTRTIYGNVSEIYGNLHSIFGNELLDKSKILCYACIIVMPNLELTNDTFTITRYGYADFGEESIFGWKPLPPLHHLEPNRYCAQRNFQRVMNKTTSKLHYTMSPLTDSTLIRRPKIGVLHTLAIDSMKKTIEQATHYKDQLVQSFNDDDKVTITYRYSPEENVFLYCELKVEKKNIQLRDDNNIGKGTIEAIVIEFKIFDEDGICSKELIFVSYKKIKHLVNLDDEQPGSESTDPSLPGSVHSDPLDSADIPLAYSSNDTSVNLSILENSTNMLFTDMFIELTNRLYHVPRDKVILFLTGEDGTPQQRTGVNNPTDESNGVKIINLSDHYSGICTIVLTTSGGQYIWSVAKATKTQINAFNEVNKYITNMTNPPWDNLNGQKEFQLYNGMTGTDEIKVTVKVLTTVNRTNELKSAEYQAELSPPYLLFANKEYADEYIKQKMGVLMTNIQAQGGLSAPLQAQGGLSAPPPPPSTLSTLLPPPATLSAPLPPPATLSAPLPPPATLSALPEGWIKQYDSETKKYFYVYMPKNHRQWYPPPPSWQDPLH
jgi:hypothetical protein